MDAALRIEDRFGFRSDRVAETLGELWALAEGLLPASSARRPPVPEAWNRPPSDSPAGEDPGRDRSPRLSCAARWRIPATLPWQTGSRGC